MDDLIPEQVNALRLVDNKSNESDWDFDLLKGELPELDLSAFDFDFSFPELDESEIEEMTNVLLQVKAMSGRYDKSEMAKRAGVPGKDGAWRAFRR